MGGGGGGSEGQSVARGKASQAKPMILDTLVSLAYSPSWPSEKTTRIKNKTTNCFKLWSPKNY